MEDHAVLPNRSTRGLQERHHRRAVHRVPVLEEVEARDVADGLLEGGATLGLPRLRVAAVHVRTPAPPTTQSLRPLRLDGLRLRAQGVHSATGELVVRTYFTAPTRLTGSLDKYDEKNQLTPSASGSVSARELATLASTTANLVRA